MKAALCLSGNFREYNRTLPSILKFIEHFKLCDVFIIYDITEKKEDLNNIINYLKPTKCKSVTSMDVCNNLNMWYKIKESFLLCKEYCKENNFLISNYYDIVIRCRFDLILENNLNFNNIIVDPNTLYYGSISDTLFRNIQKLSYLSKKFLLDEFFFGAPELVEKYFLFYDIILKSNNKCLEYGLGESDFFFYSKVLGTTLKKIQFHYIMYQWKDNLIGYTQKKWKNYPAIKNGFFSNKGTVVVILLIVFMILYIRELLNKYLKK